MLTLERLKELVSYDPETGEFTRPVRIGSRGRKFGGHKLGGVSTQGYIAIGVDGRKYLAQRIAFFYMTGSWPKNHIDHINTDRTDNRFVNLREANDSQNGANRSMNSNNKVGLKGCSWSKQNKKWQASITVNRKQTHLGFFDCPAAAHFAYIIASDKAFGEFARAA